MPYPKEYWEVEKEARGRLWREFMNILSPYAEIDAEAVRAIVRFFCEMPPTGSESSCLGDLPSLWKDSEKREEVEEDLRWLEIGLQAWRDHADALIGAVAEQDGISIEDAASRARDIWFNAGRSGGVVVSEIRDGVVVPLVHVGWLGIIESIYQRVAVPKLSREPQDRKRQLASFYGVVACHLFHLLDIERFRTIAYKTWPADRDQVRPWTDDEFTFASRYYEGLRPCLQVVGDHKANRLIDPRSIAAGKQEEPLESDVEGLRYVMFVVLGSVAIDFVEELLAFNRYHTVKGTFQCVECGQFVARTFYGHGQLYCSLQCKGRAAKRRQRERRTQATEAKQWAKRAIDLPT